MRPWMNRRTAGLVVGLLVLTCTFALQRASIAAAQTDSDCLGDASGWSCSYSAQGSSPLVSNCISSDAGSTCTYQTAGSSTETIANCINSASGWNCTYSSGSPAALAPDSTASWVYCTAPGRGSVWVKKGAASSDLLC